MELSFTTWEFHSSVSQNDPCIYEYSSMIKKSIFLIFICAKNFSDAKHVIKPQRLMKISHLV